MRIASGSLSEELQPILKVRVAAMKNSPKTTFAPVLMGAAAGLAAGALSAFFVLESKRSEPAVPAEGLAPRAVGSVESVGITGKQFDALKSQLEELQMRVAFAEAMAREARQPVALDEVEPALEMAAASDPLAQLGDLSAPVSGEFKQGVEQVMQDVRDAERRERDARRTEAIEVRTEDRLANLVTELGLTPVQTDQMREHMTEYEKKRGTLLQEARDREDFYGMRESMRDLRRESQESLATILDPTQLERFEEIDDSFRGPRDRGGRDDGDRGRGRDRDRDSGS